MASLNDYTVIITPNAGEFLAYVPAISGCQALGISPDDARAELEMVFEMFVELSQEQQRPLPSDTSTERLLAVG